MSKTCNSCGGSIANPFDLSQVSSDNCQCNLGGTVAQSTQLPSSACCVESVNGKTGVVVLNISDIDLQGNTFYSNAQVYAALSGTSPIAFDSLTGVISHVNSSVTAGTYGSAGNIPVFTVDAKGHITNVTNTPISSISIGPDLQAIEALSGTGYAIRTATNTWVLRSILGTAGRINVANGNGVSGSTAIDLIATGVTPGTYGGASSIPSLVVDAYGRVTSASTNPLPAVVIPPHTHTLGNLSNVDNAVDASTDKFILTYDAGTSSWKAVSPEIYEDDEMTLNANFKFATGTGDVDSVEDGEPISHVRRHTDMNSKRVVEINTTVYCEYDVINDILSGGPDMYFGSIRIGQMPAGYEPIHNTTVACASMVRANSYADETGANTFAGTYQIYNGLSVEITAAGVVYLLVQRLADFVLLAHSGTDYFIVPIVCSYPTKEIVP